MDHSIIGLQGKSRELCSSIFYSFRPIRQAVKQQQMQDDDIRDLAEGLREMLGAAKICADLKEIEETTQVTESIGKTALDIALLIEECTRYSSLPGKLLAERMMRGIQLIDSLFDLNSSYRSSSVQGSGITHCSKQEGL